MQKDQLPDDLDYKVAFRSKRTNVWGLLGSGAIALVTAGVAFYTYESAKYTQSDVQADPARLTQLEASQEKLRTELDQLVQQHSELVHRIQTLEGQRPKGPSAETPSPNPVERTYTVVQGDTLRRISRKYYGSTSQYQKIYDANRDKLQSASGLIPGMVLQMPER